jgi:hypothetical protein
VPKEIINADPFERSAWKKSQAGHARVIAPVGGFKAWAAAQLPVEKGAALAAEG